MKICLVSQEYPPDTARGGIGTQTWNKARALAGLGHSVQVLSAAARPGPDPAVSNHDGVTVHRIRAPGADFPVYTPAAYWLGYSWAVLRHLARLLEEQRFDLVDFAEYGGEGYAYLLDRTPWNWAAAVVQLHGPLAMLAERIEWPERGSDLYRVGTAMEDLCIRRADALMACSGAIADYVAQHQAVDRDGIEVVHCGVDAAAFTPASSPGASRDRPTVLFVGNLAPNKGVHTVLDAVVRLRSRYPQIRLQLAGVADDDTLRALRERAAAGGVAGNVEYVGFAGRDTLPELYRGAHVFCSPAQFECGVANVYLEAMACGCPVVASTAGGAPEAVIDGVTGCLVPPADPAATASALDRVLGNPGLRASMANASRRRVDDYFAMDRYIQRVLKVYSRALERSRQSRAAADTTRG